MRTDGRYICRISVHADGCARRETAGNHILLQRKLQKSKL
nr:MAG TPA: hypothetical protein [Caudoviricetes sp.]